MTGAIFGDVGVLLLVGRAVLVNVRVWLFVAGAIFAEVTIR